MKLKKWQIGGIVGGIYSLIIMSLMLIGIGAWEPFPTVLGYLFLPFVLTLGHIASFVLTLGHIASFLNITFGPSYIIPFLATGGIITLIGALVIIMCDKI